MKNIRLIVDNDRKAKQPYFIKKELQTILNLYAKMVSNGTWKDYSLYTGNKEISFNVYKKASEKPILRILKNSGRFNFNQTGSNFNTQNISRDEAYKILNLEPGKKYSKEEILNSYKKIMKKIHPDVSPELSRLASIVNEAKEIVIKDIA